MRGKFRLILENNYNCMLVLFLVLIVALAAAMAATTDYNIHPDEKVHFEAVRYYTKHWLPPAVGHQDTLESYSVYGHSRLNELGFYYFFAGKFAALLAPLTGNLLLNARLFNLLLLIILVICVLRAPGSYKLLGGVFLITPQVWYIFSYVNSDAFALFLSLAITAQLLLRDSMTMRYLNSPSYTREFYRSLPLILMAVFLYFTKSNFYIYFIFILGWGLGLLYLRSDRKQLFFKYLVMVALFLALVGARYGLDYAMFGPEKGDQLKQMQEQTAAEEYKPRLRATGEGHPNLNLRKKGISYRELFSDPYNWHRGIFYTFSGAYGHMDYFGTALYYRLMLLAYLLLTAITCFVLWPCGAEARFLLIITAALGLLTLYLASYHSWTSDFQPQGRYLFPVLAIAAYVFGRYGQELSRSTGFKVTLAAVAALSLYSFVNYGLLQL